MRPIFLLRLLVLTGIVISFSCKKDTIEQSQEDFKKFKNYISYYPQRPLNRCNDFSLSLAFAVPEGKELPHNLFEISPPIGGNYALSKNRQRITFKNADIKHNIQYQVKFNVGLLTEMPAGMNSFSFPLETERQAWDMEFSPPTNKSMEEVSFKGVVKYGVCEPDKTLIEKSFTATQEGKPLRVIWRHGSHKNHRSSNFTITHVQRKEKAGNVDVVLSMEALNVNDQAKMKLGVPAKSDFSFHAFKIDENKRMEVYFTDPLLPSQNLDGLIRIKGRKIASSKVVDNYVILYFKEQQFGHYDIEILPGIKNLAGYPLKDSYTKPIFFSPPNPEVRIAEEGNILPPGDRWEIPVSLITASGFRLRILKVYKNNVSRFYQENAEPFNYQQGLENIGRVELDTIFSFNKEVPFTESIHSLSLDRLVRKEAGALYKIILTIPDKHNVFPCEEYSGEQRLDQIESIDFDQPWIHLRYDHDYYDEGYYYGYRGNFQGHRRYQEEPNQYGYSDPCNKDFASKIHDSRLLMCTDIGIVAKSQPEKKEYFFYVSEISSASSISGAKITLRDIQGQKMSSAYTDGSGMVNIPIGEKVPFLAIAEYNNQTTYLPVQQAKSLSLSTFQVEGKDWKSDRKVFFYGERDVWRPGDSIYMHSIVFSPEKTLPSTLPVNLKLFDPSNRLIKEWSSKKNLDGIYDLRFATNDDDPTGYWKLVMKLGGKKHSTPIRIETIRPNRLKMEMDFVSEKLIKKDQSKTADVKVKWMHGLEAKELRTEVEMLQKSLSNPFGTDYKNYVFNDLSKKYNTFLGMVKTGATDKNGVLTFKIPVEDDMSYPSMMLFNFDLKSYEKGGAFSTDMKSIKYSPYTHYIGAKFPGGDDGSEIYIKDGEAIMLTAIDQDGKPERRKVKVQLFDIDYNWWYQFGNKGDYAAMSNHLGELEKEYQLQINKEGTSLAIQEYGRFLLKIQDEKSGHSISRIIYSYGNGWNRDKEEVSQLEVLPLRLDKSDFKVNEQLDFKLPPMQKGKYLITIENGGTILHKEVRSTSSAPTQISIPVTSEMAPTAYVHVHLIQAWKEHKNDRPLRLFGIKPIKVYDPSTVLEPRIEMPEVITTDEKFSLEVSEQNGRAMSYTLAIVDEGLLDITQFKTPDPWSVFFGKESLNVRTWDMYRDIFQRFLGEYTSLLAVGGDGSNAIAPASKARRFKPVVKFLGPFKLNGFEKKVHDLTVNDYVGSVRAMVVATNGKALGRYEETSPVKKPLMLYSTLPRVLGPEEKLKVPVTVFSMNKDIKEVTATIKGNDQINIIGNATQSITFEKEGEKDIYFEIETKGNIGIAQVEVDVRSGIYSYTEKIELDVRPSANQFTRTFQDIVSKSSTKTINYTPFGMDGTRSGNITVSKGLNFSFKPQVDWLSRYPHGCLEQTVSRIFPQIYLYKMNLLEDSDQMKYRQQYEAAIQKLRFLQLPEGGFAYWPGGRTPNKWGTTYALQFLLEAKKYGYKVPEDMIKKCVSFQNQRAESSFSAPTNGYNYSTLDEAYLLYTLALAGKPNYGAMNRLRLVPSLHSTSKWMLAHAFIKVGEEDIAKTILEGVAPNVDDYRELSGNFGSTIRDQALIARVLLDMDDKIKAKTLIDEMITEFNADQLWTLSTQDRSQALITFAQFAGQLDQVEDSLVYSIQAVNQFQEKDVILDKEIDEYPLETEAIKAYDLVLENKGGDDIYTSISMTGQELRDESKASSKDLKLEINYLSDDLKSIDPGEIKKGADFIVEYKLTHTGVRTDYKNMAMTAIFPSGWEILNQRMKQNSTFNSGDDADYQDIRDDRVMLYFNLDKGKQKTFRFKLNASYEGKYWAPPAYCEAMYDAKINAKSKGFWAEVK